MGNVKKFKQEFFNPKSYLNERKVRLNQMGNCKIEADRTYILYKKKITKEKRTCSKTTLYPSPENCTGA